MKTRVPTFNRGQNMVEFALIAPILILLLLIIIDLGRITYTYSALHNAAREGARYGVIDPGNISAVEDRTRAYAIGLNQDDLAVTAIYNATAETIEVTAVYNFRTASPILSLLVDGDSFTLQAVSLMATEE